MCSENYVHPSADELENCLLDRVSEEDRRVVEEHLLVCDTCRDSLQNIHATILARNWALEQIEREESARSGKWVRFGIPARAYAGCCAAAVIALFGWTYMARTGGPIPESHVSLTATRSGAAAQSAFVVAGSRVTLNLDTTSLPASGRYMVEVVDLAGARVWGGEVEARTPGLTVRLARPLPAGRYWVRLNTANGAALREFELRVQ
jgi:hypothetical protein